MFLLHPESFMLDPHYSIIGIILVREALPTIRRASLTKNLAGQNIVCTQNIPYCKRFTDTVFLLPTAQIIFFFSGQNVTLTSSMMATS